MARVTLPRSRLANFPFRLLPHFQFTAEELERTLTWEEQFGENHKWSKIALLGEPRSELSKESLRVQSSPIDESGEYLLVISPNTVLHPSALFIIKKQLAKFQSDLIYWDESKFKEDTFALSTYYRKGRPSRVSFIGRNIIGSSAVVKRSLWEQFAISTHGITENLWSVSLHSKAPLHIPLCLSSTVEQAHTVLESDSALKSQLMDSLEAVHPEQISFKTGGIDLSVHVTLESIDDTIGVVIPFKDQSDITISCLLALSKQKGAEDLHLRLINNNSSHTELGKVRKKLAELNFKSALVIDDTRYFNFARLNNLGIKELLSLGCSDIVLMNNDVVLGSPDFIKQAQAWSRFPSVGLVGGTLNYPSGAIQSAGVNFSQVRPANVSSGNLFADKLREVDGLCFATVLIRREVIEALGGLDEIECPNGYGDTLFCQRARVNGYTSILVPWLSATHHESVSRGNRPEELELLELVQNGLRISDLWSDLEAERQPMIIPLGPSSSAFQAVVRQISSSKRFLAIAEALSKPIVRLGKGLKKRAIINKSN